MKLCAFIETEDKQDCAYFTKHGHMLNGLFIHVDVDEQGRFAGHKALMVRFPAGERGKDMGNLVYTDLTRREGYKRVQLKAYEEQNALNLVRSYLSECFVLT